MTRRSAWLLLGLALSVKPSIAVAASAASPGSLAGVSGAGLPYILPAIFSLAFLAVGWLVVLEREGLFRMLGLACLLGSSALADTPMWRALDWRDPYWETPPLMLVSGMLAVRGWIALRSRVGFYRLLGWSVGVTIACAVLLPWVSAAVARWPHLVIGLGYGTMAAFLTVSLYAHDRHRRAQHG